MAKKTMAKKELAYGRVISLYYSYGQEVFQKVLKLNNL